MLSLASRGFLRTSPSSGLQASPCSCWRRITFRTRRLARARVAFGRFRARRLARARVPFVRFGAHRLPRARLAPCFHTLSRASPHSCRRHICASFRMRCLARHLARARPSHRFSGLQRVSHRSGVPRFSVSRAFTRAASLGCVSHLRTFTTRVAMRPVASLSLASLSLALCCYCRTDASIGCHHWEAVRTGAGTAERPRCKL